MLTTSERVQHDAPEPLSAEGWTSDNQSSKRRRANDFNTVSTSISERHGHVDVATVCSPHSSGILNTSSKSHSGVTNTNQGQGVAQQLDFNSQLVPILPETPSCAARYIAPPASDERDNIPVLPTHEGESNDSYGNLLPQLSNFAVQPHPQEDQQSFSAVHLPAEPDGYVSSPMPTTAPAALVGAQPRQNIFIHLLLKFNCVQQDIFQPCKNAPRLTFCIQRVNHGVTRTIHEDKLVFITVSISIHNRTRAKSHQSLLSNNRGDMQPLLLYRTADNSSNAFSSPAVDMTDWPPDNCVIRVSIERVQAPNNKVRRGALFQRSHAVGSSIDVTSTGVGGNPTFDIAKHLSYCLTVEVDSNRLRHETDTRCRLRCCLYPLAHPQWLVR